MGDRRHPGSERLQDCRVFHVRRVVTTPPGAPRPRDYYLIEAPDWVNVVPVTDEGRVVLIRQYRVGIDEDTLEVPGGMCDPGESPPEAAARELREETGYEAREIVPLGWVHPNPAIQTNRCHSFVARGVRLVGPATPGEDEKIEVVTVPLAEVPRLIEKRRITHALVVSAFHLLGLGSV